MIVSMHIYDNRILNPNLIPCPLFPAKVDWKGDTFSKDQKDFHEDVPTPRSPSPPPNPTTPPSCHHNLSNASRLHLDDTEKDPQVPITDDEDEEVVVPVPVITDNERVLQDLQAAIEMGIELRIPRMRNTNKKNCWFGSAIRLCHHHYNNSLIGAPSIEDFRDDPFAVLFHDYLQTNTSSAILVDPMPLMVAFAQRYLPHRPLDNVINDYWDSMLFFESLIGRDNKIPRCTYMESLQILIKRVTTSTTCCQPHNFPDQTRYESLLSIAMPERESLSSAVVNSLRDGAQHGHTCAECGARVQNTVKDIIIKAPDCVFVFVYLRTANANQDVRPAIQVEDHLELHTVEDGLVQYRFNGSAQHVGENKAFSIFESLLSSMSLSISFS